ncbi:MAG: hypothetical protein AAF211_22860, partial [Myxococcota bacterium]
MARRLRDVELGVFARTERIEAMVDPPRLPVVLRLVGVRKLTPSLGPLARFAPCENALPNDLRSHRWVTWAPQLDDVSEADWLTHHVPDA